MAGRTTSIECLPSDVITHIGSFLDYASRLRAFATSKVFTSISYGFPYQVVNLAHQPNFVTHLPYIKQFKARCDHVDIVCASVNDPIPLDVLESMVQMSEYLNTNFKVVSLTIKQTSLDILESILKATQKWRINMLHIDLKETDSVTQRCNDLLLNMKADDYKLMIHEKHLDILNCENVIGRLNRLIVSVQSDVSGVINFEHARNADYVELITNQTNDVSCPEYITTLNLFDLNWFHAEESGLFKSLRKAKEDRMPMRLSNVYMMEHVKAVKNTHVLNNFWYHLLRVLPEGGADRDIAYLAKPDNVGIIQMVKMMRKSQPQMKLAYACDDGYLVARVVKHFIPDLDIYGKHGFSSSFEGAKDMKLGDIYERMTEDARVYWSWLENRDGFL